MNITPSRVLARASVAAHGSLLLVLAACTAPAPTPEADLLILNARVCTLTWGEPAVDGTPAADAPYDPLAGWRPDAEAVAARDGRILFAGSNADAERFRGERTQVLDAAGGTLIPRADRRPRPPGQPRRFAGAGGPGGRGDRAGSGGARRGAGGAGAAG